MKTKVRSTAVASSFIFACAVALVACGSGSGTGKEISGAFEPEYPPGTPRYVKALSTQLMEFKPGFKVEPTSGRGKHTWDYRIRGSVIEMKNDTLGFDKSVSIGDGSCLVQHKGMPDLELRYCPRF